MLSHFVIDSLMPKGIGWLYPQPYSAGFPTGIHSYAADAILIALSGLVALGVRMDRS